MSNRGPSAYQPNALPLDHTGSQPLCMFDKVIYMLEISERARGNHSSPFIVPRNNSHTSGCPRMTCTVVGPVGAMDRSRALAASGNWFEPSSCRDTGEGQLQALVYDILPSTTAVFSYAIGSRKLSANEQFFVGAQTVVSLLQTTQIKQGVTFIAANKVYTSTNKTTIV